MFQYLGDAEKLNELREANPDKFHCAWLRRDPHACESMPSGVDGIKAGCVCPHNAYVHKQQVFANRDAVLDNVERLMRLVGSADLGVLSEKDLDPMTLTELLTAKAELTRQQNDRQQRAYEQAKMESEKNRAQSTLR